MGKLNVPIEKPRPDAGTFIKAITTDYEPGRPPLIEYIIKDSVRKTVIEMVGRKWVGLKEDWEGYWDNFIAFWYHMGYDFVRLELGMGLHGAEGRRSEDDGRVYAETATGPIGSWEDFETYDWPDPSKADFRPYEYIASHLPEGMGLIANHGGGMLEHLTSLMGYEPLCIAVMDQADLVQAVADRIGGLMEAYYRRILQLDRLIAIFPGDDMGFRSSTLLSPADLRRYTLPWHKRFAAMAHEAGVPYILHSCGNIEQIMEYLITDVGIDAKHSFEDAILPIGEVKRRYGGRIGILGGVDMDKLTRLDPDALRSYVRDIIEECAPGGRFAIGSGNSIPDYVSVENYLTMIDEALR
jgi:uroporphyrinogen decarboxylase